MTTSLRHEWQLVRRGYVRTTRVRDNEKIRLKGNPRERKEGYFRPTHYLKKCCLLFVGPRIIFHEVK
jgi:hypothetical protein